MSNLIKLFLILITCVLGFVLVASAQEALLTEVSPEVIEAINLDEDIQSEDLGIEEPRLLPDSPFYFLKNWGRAIQFFFAFNPITKAELRLEFANEKLIEVKKLIEKEKEPEVIKKGLENYQKEIRKIKIASDKIKVKAEESPEVSSFLDKFTKHQILHHRILQRLETQVPPQVFEKIEEVRERHLERFGEVMIKLEDRMEELRVRLEKNLEEIKGSKYKNFKNLEVLIELKEKVPEKAKEAIQKAQENALKRLQGDLEKMSPEDQEKFKEYIGKISGEGETQLEILENLKSELKEKSVIKEKIMEAKEKVWEKIKVSAEKINCPTIEKPASGFCEEGRLIAEKDSKGCIISFDCVIPAELECEVFITCEEGYTSYNTGEKDSWSCPIRKCIKKEVEKPEVACITLWDPVCGKDGKTYSNACFAKLAGAEIAYKGRCKEKGCQTDTDCPQLRCGPAGTISARCIGMKAKCVEGKCQIISTLLPVKLQAEEVPE